MNTTIHSTEQAVRDRALRRAGGPFGIYVHVPFCASRCGYCDFNTYTAGELGSATSPVDWERAAHAEIEAAAEALGRAGDPPPVETVFFGGGTPSLVGADVLNGVLERIRSTFGLAPGAEVTTECNPESTSPEFFATLRRGGFTRVSLGMQSTAEHVLRVLDRRHSPGRPTAAVAEARAAGFDHVNLDVIYGTPGETGDDLRRTLDAVVGAGCDHVSAYSLIVEDGTALARRVRRGEVPPTDDDVLADRYEQVVAHLAEHGFSWYEVSNFATGAQARCRHNLLYWRGGDWWGVGPGAHSHLDGLRWWNVRHPARYAAACDAGELPVADHEDVSAADRHVERLMLGLRLLEGVPDAELDAAERERARALVARGVLRRRPGADGYAVTEDGRLVADGAVRELLG